MRGFPFLSSKIKLKYFLLFFSLLFLSVDTVEAQFWKKVTPSFLLNKPKNNVLPIDSTQLLQLISKDVNVLSSPKFGGRRMGTQGAQQSGLYVAKSLNSSGIYPSGEDFVHIFRYVDSKSLDRQTRFMIGRNYISVPEEAFPSPYSSYGVVRNYIIPNCRNFGQPWIIPLYQNVQQAKDPHFDWVYQTYLRAKVAQNRGASAVIFYDNYDSPYAPKYQNEKDTAVLNIPVLILNDKAYKDKVSGISVMTMMSLDISYKNDYKKAANIVGYLNNMAPYDVLICAHYDGYGGSNQANPNYWGANDNASGVAAMMALARLINKSGLKNYNYIFAAVSGGTRGQLGAEALLQDKKLDKERIAYVFNFDRVGDRFYGQKKQLYINGLTSSEAWLSFFTKAVKGWHFNLEDSSVAVSDYKPFMDHEIPALSFSTYPKELNETAAKVGHKVDMDMINNVAIFAYNIILQMNQMPQPAFAKPIYQRAIKKEIEQLKYSNEIWEKNKRTDSRSTSQPEAPIIKEGKVATQAKVVGKLNFLGIVCDSTYEGYGVRIQDVKKQEPAAEFGLKSGDIIMEIDKVKINNFKDYLAVLNRMKPGEKLEFKVKRGVTVQGFMVVNL